MTDPRARLIKFLPKNVNSVAEEVARFNEDGTYYRYVPAGTSDRTSWYGRLSTQTQD